MSVWKKYPLEQQEEYIKFLQIYASLSNLFRQKKGELIPYLDSKFQETVFARVFKSENTDIGNTPHDIVSIVGGERIGIGLKTWIGNKPSFQKVMQLKSFQKEIEQYIDNKESLAYTISAIKNQKMIFDYNRLGLSETGNIYHYITREKDEFTINECAYPLVDLKNLKNFKKTNSSFLWSDGLKDYKYTFGDSQIWQKFDSEKYNSLVLEKFKVKVIEDPFSLLLEVCFDAINSLTETKDDIIEVYLPLYSYKTKEVLKKSGLNAWNAAPKNRNSNTPRPLNEVYIPIPLEFHKHCPNFFVEDIFKLQTFSGNPDDKSEVRFHLQLPNGKKIPALLTQDNMKALQSGSKTERDENNKLYGQAALGQWLLVDVLGLKERKLVTLDWLKKRDTDCVKLWRKNNDYSTIYIDFAPLGTFEKFMNNELYEQNDDLIVDSLKRLWRR